MPKHVWPYIIGFIAITFWGGTPPATQVAVAGIDALDVGMLRTVLAGALLLPLGLLLRLPRPSNRQGWTELAASAIGGSIGFTLLFSLGVKLTSTAHAALIIAAAPVLTGFIGFALQRRWPRGLWWVGAVIAMIGEAVLIGSRAVGATQGAATVEGDLIVLASVAFVSIGYVGGSRLSARIGTGPATTWALSLAGVLLLPVLLARIAATPLDLSAANAGSWTAMAYLVLAASIGGNAAWSWALGHGGIVHISPLQYIQPVISLVIAVLLFSEVITPPVIVSLVIILAGVILTRVALMRVV
ncbi:MAG: DMT family transporter [Chloroflexi bacterium]|nr:DMT family transporter [Chloroflexota bacterium]